MADDSGFIWDGEEPERLRGSLGPRRLTVWLPSGTRSVRRISRFLDPLSTYWSDVSGSHDRGSRQRIRMWLADGSHVPPTREDQLARISGARKAAVSAGSRKAASVG